MTIQEISEYIDFVPPLTEGRRIVCSECKVPTLAEYWEKETGPSLGAVMCPVCYSSYYEHRFTELKTIK